MSDHFGFGEFGIALAGIVCMFGWPLLWIVAHYAYQARKVSLETGLKRDMVARGYSAQEIIDVVAAKRGDKNANSCDIPPAKPIKNPAYGA
jgi:hypothetical protein